MLHKNRIPLLNMKSRFSETAYLIILMMSGWMSISCSSNEEIYQYVNWMDLHYQKANALYEKIYSLLEQNPQTEQDIRQFEIQWNEQITIPWQSMIQELHHREIQEIPLQSLHSVFIGNRQAISDAFAEFLKDLSIMTIRKQMDHLVQQLMQYQQDLEHKYIKPFQDYCLTLGISIKSPMKTSE